MPQGADQATREAGTAETYLRSVINERYDRNYDLSAAPADWTVSAISEMAGAAEDLAMEKANLATDIAASMKFYDDQVAVDEHDMRVEQAKLYTTTETEAARRNKDFSKAIYAVEDSYEKSRFQINWRFYVAHANYKVNHLAALTADETTPYDDKTLQYAIDMAQAEFGWLNSLRPAAASYFNSESSRAQIRADAIADASFNSVEALLLAIKQQLLNEAQADKQLDGIVAANAQIAESVMAQRIYESSQAYIEASRDYQLAVEYLAGGAVEDGIELVRDANLDWVDHRIDLHESRISAESFENAEQQIADDLKLKLADVVREFEMQRSYALETWADGLGRGVRHGDPLGTGAITSQEDSRVLVSEQLPRSRTQIHPCPDRQHQDDYFRGRDSPRRASGARQGICDDGESGGSKLRTGDENGSP